MRVLFSVAATICLITSYCVSVSAINIWGLFEHVFLALAGWYGGYRAVTGIFMLGALSYLLRAINKYSFVKAQFLRRLTFCVAVIFGWKNIGLSLATAFAMQWPLRARTSSSPLYHDDYFYTFNPRHWIIPVLCQFNLMTWVACCLMSGDIVTACARGVLCARNFIVMISCLLSEEERTRRKYIRHARKYKRHIKY